MNISIIGAGNMATGIGTRILAGKHTLTIYNRDTEKAKALAEKLGNETKTAGLGGIIEGDVIIFALPYNAIPQVIEDHKDQLQGKILVDISNPVDFQTFTLVTPPGSSGAQEIAKHLPEGATLVKAFNTIFAGTLMTGEVDGKKLDVFIAGDDEDAKKTIAQIVEDGGLRPLDTGPLANSHLIEAMQAVHMKVQSKLGNTWMTTMKVLL